MRVIILLALGLAAVAAVHRNPQRIVGGTTTTIEDYPFGASLLKLWFGTSLYHLCGGSILNTRSILTAGHCIFGELPRNLRIRVGSTYANSGGHVHNTARLFLHPQYNDFTLDNDVAIMQASTNFVYGTNVQPARIAGHNYHLSDNAPVWAIGWGRTSFQGVSSEILRHVQIWTINQGICRSRYADIGDVVTENMLCSGWLDVGGRDQCQGDSGSPLLHNNVVVGICSWGYKCATARYPGVNARVSRYTSWIQSNA